jgi:hypothetical protein
MRDADHTPVHPDAYGGEPGLPAGLPGSWRRSPFVVDEPGVFVGGDGDEGQPRLVPWESVLAVVLYRTTARVRGEARDVQAVGLRLTRSPDVVSVQRVLQGWSLDRARLEAAVARFAPGVEVVDGPAHGPSAAPAWGPVPQDGPPEAGAEPAPAHGTPEPARDTTGTTGSPGTPAPAYGTPDPAGDAAYVVRPDASNVAMPALLAAAGLGGAGFGAVNGMGLFSLIALAFCFPLGKHLLDAHRGVVYFAVDAGGVHLGESDDEHAPPAPAAPVRWESIGSVIVFQVQEITRTRDSDGRYLDSSNWHTAVGVTRRGGPEGSVAHYQLFRSYRLDRPALERAVERYGGGVPVLDGPAIGERDLGDVIGTLWRTWRGGGANPPGPYG